MSDKLNILLGMTGGCIVNVLCTGEELKFWVNSIPNVVKNNEYISRLYKKYVKFEDLDKTEEALFNIRNTSELSGKVYKSYLSCKESALGCKQEWGKYLPIYIEIIGGQGLFIKIPLEDYDNLEGDPFWMRPEYIEEKYCVDWPPKK